MVILIFSVYQKQTLCAVDCSAISSTLVKLERMFIYTVYWVFFHKFVHSLRIMLILSHSEMVTEELGLFWNGISKYHSTIQQNEMLELSQCPVVFEFQFELSETLRFSRPQSLLQNTPTPELTAHHANMFQRGVQNNCASWPSICKYA